MARRSVDTDTVSRSPDANEEKALDRSHIEAVDFSRVESIGIDAALDRRITRKFDRHIVSSPRNRERALLDVVLRLQLGSVAFRSVAVGFHR